MSITTLKAKTMKVADLRKELSDRGLNSTGLKSSLVKRLIADIEKKKKKKASSVVVEEKKEVSNGDVSKVTPTTLSGLLKSIESKAEDELTEFEKNVKKRKARAEKFGTAFKLNDAEMADLRRERFGIQTAKLPLGKRGLTEAEKEKMSKRARRFGSNTTASGMLDEEEKKKREARSKRFESTA